MVEILTYILIGLSLSIDAMTVSISYGMIINNIKEKIFSRNISPYNANNRI